MDNYYNASYPESGDSSPRSREIEFENPPPWEDSQTNQPPPNYRVKFMCSYGGKIHPRPNDNQLSYIGGDTKILAVDRNIKFSALLSKLTALCEGDNNISFKYQLPGEDLDALISVTNDDDLEHMMHEYERLYRISPKPTRLRIFVFSAQNQSLNSSTRSFDSDDVKSEKDRFVEALNTAPILTTPQPQMMPPASVTQPQPPATNVDFLFGFEKANAMAAHPPVQQPMAGRVQEVEDHQVVAPGLDERFMAMDPIQKHIQDLQRLRLEEQQGIYRRKSDDSIGGGSTGGGEYYRVPEKISPVTVSPGGVPYWTDKQVPAGVFSASTVNSEQPVYMIQAPANAYHAPVMRPMAGAPTQGYYTVQRIPSEVYREQQQQQQQIYNMIPQGAVAPMTGAPPPSTLGQHQKPPGGYSEGFGMVRPASTGGIGMMTETAAYAQMAYDGGVGRQQQVVYPGAGAPYHHQAAAAAAADMRLNHQQEAAASGGKGHVARVTQTSI